MFHRFFRAWRFQQPAEARIGNAIVLAMRTELFEHSQRTPLAFFTRTQTGALVSRPNNDVGGAGFGTLCLLSRQLTARLEI